MTEHYCQDCGISYTAGNRSIRCPECREIHDKQYALEYSRTDKS